MADSKFKHLIEVAPGFYNLRAPLLMFGGLVDVRTHMSFCRLSSGKILVIDTCEISPDQKAEIDKLTSNGDLIEAVIATHPFHTLFFAPFYKSYPKAKYYGTPRHLRNIKGMTWEGDVRDVLSKWEPDIFMRIPGGTEFVNPVENDHFSSVFLLHKSSRTLHVDDTIMYVDQPTCALSCCLRSNSMFFHLGLGDGTGLLATAESANQFKGFIESILKDWDFDNICTAHFDIKYGGAKAQLSKVLVDAQPALVKHAKKYGGTVTAHTNALVSK